MAEININGINCQFLGAPLAALKNYNPTTRTHYLAWRTLPSPHNITIKMMLNSAFEIGAFERPPYWVLDDDRHEAVLLENPSQSIMDSICSWLNWTGGCNRIYCCPYADALREELLRSDEVVENANRWYDYNHHKLYLKATYTTGSPLKIPTDAPANNSTD